MALKKILTEAAQKGLAQGLWLGQDHGILTEMYYTMLQRSRTVLYSMLSSKQIQPFSLITTTALKGHKQFRHHWI